MIRHRLLLFSALVTCATGSLWTSSASATVDDACVPALGGLGAGAPVIDGIVDENNDAGATGQTDPGWNGASRLILKEPMGTTRTSALQLGVSGNDVYIGGVVDIPVIDENDRVVLGFSTDADPTHDWKIIIKPFKASDTGTFKNHHIDGTSTVEYWRDSTLVGAAPKWNTDPSTTASGADWLIDATRFAYAKTGTSWSFEMKIPKAAGATSAGPGATGGIYFPPSGVFSFYVDIISTAHPVASFNESPWPKQTSIGTGYLTQLMPAKGQWGALSFNDRAECAGVSIDSAHIGVVDPTNPANIVTNIRRFDPIATTEPDLASCNALADYASWPTKAGPPNILVAKPLNQMGGTAKVSALFRIANWGLPGPSDWNPIAYPAAATPPTPPLVNPTVEQPIGPSAYGSLTVPWTLTYKQSCQYTYSGAWAGHQCIHVDLDSSDPNTRFKNKSVEQNMNFIHASDVAHKALISARGYPPPAGRPAQTIELHVRAEVMTAADERAARKAGIRPPRCSAEDPARGITGCCDGGQDSASPNKSEGQFNEKWMARCGGDSNEGPLYETLKWVVDGYLWTDDFLVISNEKYRRTKYVGSFGHYIRHFIEHPEFREKANGLSTVQWNHALRATGAAGGASVKSIKVSGKAFRKEASSPALDDGADVYTVDIAPGGEVEVGATISATEAPPGQEPQVIVLCNCPAQGTTTTALDAPREVKLGSIFVLALLGLRRRRRGAE